MIMMKPQDRLVIVLNFLKDDAPKMSSIQVGKLNFRIIEHRIGWNFDLAAKLIEKYDGFADGFAMSGLKRGGAVGKVKATLHRARRLVRKARRTPVYFGEEVSNLFTDWTLKRVLREFPQFFRGKKTLFHCAIASPFYTQIVEAGADVAAADLLLLEGLPILLKGAQRIEWATRASRELYNLLDTFELTPLRQNAGQSSAFTDDRLIRWIAGSEIFVTFGSMLERLRLSHPERLSQALSGKTVVVDFLEEGDLSFLNAAGVAHIIEATPNSPKLEQLRSLPFSILSAIIDQLRISEDSAMSFEEFTLKWIDELKVQPNRLRGRKGDLPRRCAFVIHPLSQKQLWMHPKLKALASAPESVRSVIEKAAARSPVFHYGTIRGAVSQATGQEVVCDVYAIPATPRQILSMNEELIYERLNDAMLDAQKRGALMGGLGAYLKVAGDAGVTVAKRAPLPVTTGNSYSAATTLWAARVMVEKLGIVSNERVGKKLRAKAMVVGATGSIGRVAALLLSLVFEEIVLVGLRIDKLLEIRDEVLEVAPDIHVTVTTNPNPDLWDTDLVVTATSNVGGSVLDIELVKPGAVICDCSRPLDIRAEDAAKRPDVMIIQSGEVDLPGNIRMGIDIGLPKPSVYACLAETVLLTMEGRYETFSLSRELSHQKVKEIYKLGLKHGARLSAIRGHSGVVTDAEIARCRELALDKLRQWPARKRGEGHPPGLRTGELVFAADALVELAGEGT